MSSSKQGSECGKMSRDLQSCDDVATIKVD